MAQNKTACDFSGEIGLLMTSQGMHMADGQKLYTNAYFCTNKLRWRASQVSPALNSFYQKCSEIFLQKPDHIVHLENFNCPLLEQGKNYETRIGHGCMVSNFQFVPNNSQQRAT